jgi:CheY-like chemotaxis protein
LLPLVAGMIGVAIADDHARTEAERARLAALEAVEAKSRFLVTMSHEIRAPMNGVLGMLKMVSQTRLDADRQDYVETARGSADALLTLINNILDSSKIEAGKLDLERVPFDLRPVADDVASLLSARNESSGLALVCYIPVALDTRVIGDHTRLRQVLNNLIGNAINQRVALSMLTRLGLTADVADDGRKALAAAARGRYDLNRPGFLGGSNLSEDGAMKTSTRYSPEVRERAVRMVREHHGPTRSCARPRRMLPRRSSTAPSSDESLHRRPPRGLRGRADLQGTADRPVDRLRACSAPGGSCPVPGSPAPGCCALRADPPQRQGGNTF